MIKVTKNTQVIEAKSNKPFPIGASRDVWVDEQRIVLVEEATYPFGQVTQMIVDAGAQLLTIPCDETVEEVMAKVEELYES